MFDELFESSSSNKIETNINIIYICYTDNRKDAHDSQPA